MSATLVITGPADLRDSRWLDEQTAIVTAGIETVHAVREAALAIFTNWQDARRVGRFHPGQTAGDYIASITGHVRLPKPQRNELIAVLSGSGMSTREVAKVAGVHHSTVAEAVVGNPTPPVVTGADGKSYPKRPQITRVPVEDGADIDEEGNCEEFTELLNVMGAIEALSDASHYASAVPLRRRATTAKKLRTLGGYLGSIAWHLEQLGA